MKQLIQLRTWLTNLHNMQQINMWFVIFLLKDEKREFSLLSVDEACHYFFSRRRKGWVAWQQTLNSLKTAGNHIQQCTHCYLKQLTKQKHIHRECFSLKDKSEYWYFFFKLKVQLCKIFLSAFVCVVFHIIFTYEFAFTCFSKMLALIICFSVWIKHKT